MDMEMPALADDHFGPIELDKLFRRNPDAHPPRILLLHGSVRARSFSRLANEEAARILQRLGCETRAFDASGLPLADDADDSHPKVAELRDLVIWSEGMVWCSPERHGAMSGQDARRNAGLRRFAEFQCRQSASHSRSLDAFGHHSEPVINCQGVSGVR